jgi:hypothetical protein
MATPLRAAAPLSALLLALAMALVGCASTPDDAAVAAPAYAPIFDAARNALRAHDFELERVDAAAGVIRTRPRSSAGLATPWIDHADSFGESVDDLLNRERRTAEVRFRPLAIEGDGDVLLEGDLRTHAGPFAAEVTVTVERVYLPGRRPSPTAVRLGGVARDPAQRQAGLQPAFAIQRGVDEPLAARIAAWMREQLAAPIER